MLYSRSLLVIYFIHGSVQKCVIRVSSVASDSMRPHGPKPIRLFCQWNFPKKNTGVGCHAILQGIFPTQGSNPSLLHLLYCWVGYLPLVPPGKPHLKVSNCQQPSHGLTHAGPSLTRMRLQQREQVLTNEARNSTYSSCV